MEAEDDPEEEDEEVAEIVVVAETMILVMLEEEMMTLDQCHQVTAVVSAGIHRYLSCPTCGAPEPELDWHQVPLLQYWSCDQGLVSVLLHC